MGTRGPAPKPADQRRRRNPPKANTVKLPAEGRQGPPPPWPLAGRTPNIWAELWRTPMAVVWERNGWQRFVARYVRVVLYAERSLDKSALAEARQMEDRLGLNPLALVRLEWEISTDEVAEQRQTKPAETTPRRTLKVV